MSENDAWVLINDKFRPWRKAKAWALGSVYVEKSVVCFRHGEKKGRWEEMSASWKQVFFPLAFFIVLLPSFPFFNSCFVSRHRYHFFLAGPTACCCRSCYSSPKLSLLRLPTINLSWVERKRGSYDGRTDKQAKGSSRLGIKIANCETWVPALEKNTPGTPICIFVCVSPRVNERQKMKSTKGSGDDSIKKMCFQIQQTK